MFCKQVKQIPKISDYVNFGARLRFVGQSGNPISFCVNIKEKWASHLFSIPKTLFGAFSFTCLKKPLFCNI